MCVLEEEREEGLEGGQRECLVQSSGVETGEKKKHRKQRWLQGVHAWPSGHVEVAG